MITLVTYRVEYIQWICVAYVCIWLQEIIPFIDKQWENLTTQSRRTKQTWHATVAKTLVILGLICNNHQFDQSLLSHAIIMICTRLLNQFQKYLLYNAFALIIFCSQSKDTELFTYKEDNLGDPHFGLTLNVREFTENSAVFPFTWTFLCQHYFFFSLYGCLTFSGFVQSWSPLWGVEAEWQCASSGEKWWTCG